MAPDETQLSFGDFGLVPPILRSRWSVDGRPQTQRKLEIVRRYLSDWVPIMLRFFEEVFYVDCFAGRGWYESAEGPVAGTPVIGAEAARRYQTVWARTGSTGKSRLICRMVELDQTNHGLLAQAMAPFSAAVDVQVYKARFQDQIEKIFLEIGNRPALVLLDPYGIKDLPFTAVETVLSHPGEVLINLSSMGIVRCAGFLEALDNATSEVARVRARKQIDLVNSVYGTDAWQATVRDKSGSSADQEARLVGLYEDNLRRYRRYVISRRLPTRKDFGGTMFHLLFATDNETGLEKFSDATFIALRKSFQTKPASDYLVPMLIRKYRGSQVEWGQIVMDLGTPFRTTWLRAGLKELVRDGAITESELSTREGRRNPIYDFTNAGKLPSPQPP